MKICRKNRYWGDRYDTIRYIDIKTIHRYFRRWTHH